MAIILPRCHLNLHRRASLPTEIITLNIDVQLPPQLSSQPPPRLPPQPPPRQPLPRSPPRQPLPPPDNLYFDINPDNL